MWTESELTVWKVRIPRIGRAAQANKSATHTHSLGPVSESLFVLAANNLCRHQPQASAAVESSPSRLASSIGKLGQLILYESSGLAPGDDVPDREPESARARPV